MATAKKGQTVLQQSHVSDCILMSAAGRTYGTGVRNSDGILLCKMERDLAL